MEPKHCTRYSQLYSTFTPKNSDSWEPARISFLSNDTGHFTDLLVRSRRRQQKRALPQAPPPTVSGSQHPGNGNEAVEETTSLLQLLRSRRQSALSMQLPDTIGAPSTTIHEVEDEKYRREERCSRMAGCCGGGGGGCVCAGVGRGGGGAEGACASTSRSRVSCISHYVDLNSVLSTHALARIKTAGKSSKIATSSSPPPPPPTVRFSLRRLMCPVCSEKWRDRSSIINIKNSGLKRNSAFDRKTSVIVPARLQTAIKCPYNPRPILEEMDSCCAPALSGWHCGGSAWQLSRARCLRVKHAALVRARTPPGAKPSRSPPPPPRALLSQADLERRVNSFLSH